MAFIKVSLGSFVDTQRQVTDISSKRLVTIEENSRLLDVLSLLFSEGVRKIPIIDKAGNLKGIVSSIDILSLLGGGDKHEIFRKNMGSMELKTDKFATRQVKTIHFRTSIKKALETFKTERSGMYPLTDSRKLISVVSEWDFVKLIDRPVGIKIGEIMVERPLFVQKKHTTYEAAKMMCRGGFRRLPVVEENILLGVITPTDILSHVKNSRIWGSLVADKTRVEHVMKKEVVTVSADDDLFTAASIMKGRHIGGLPVVDDEELVGIVTERDIVDVLA